MRVTAMTVLSAVCASLVVLFASAPASAQSSGSAIVGVVKDETGAVLPGVTVEAASPALIEKVKVTVTDAQGAYQIIDLRPGEYVVTFSLEGFQTLKRAGITLSTSFTAKIDETLKTRTIEESVTVSGQAPVVDVRQSTSERALSQQLIEGVPTARGIFALAALVAGATANKPDVGGSQTHQLQSISIHGSVTGDVTWKVEGLDLNTSNGPGLNATYFNQGLQQEVSLQTKALSAEVPAGGVMINMIPKDGGNRFSSSNFFSFTNKSLQSYNVSDDQKARGLTAPAGVKKLEDINPAFGGPIVKDRAWFYGSYRYWRNDRLAAQVFNTDGSQAPDEQLLAFYSGRLTLKIDDKNRLTGYIDWNKKQRDHRRDRTSTYQFIAPEASYYQRQGGPTDSIKWTSTASDKLLVEAGYSKTRIEWHLWDQPTNSPTALPLNDLVLSTLTGAADKQLTIDRPTRHQFTFVTSWLPNTSHNIRMGVQFAKMPYETGYGPDQHGDMIARFNNGVPNSVLVMNSPVLIDEKANDLGVFVQDAWTMKRLTINAGVRFERFNGEIPAQDAPAGTFVPARHFNPITNVPNWNTVVPRLAGVFDLFGNGKTAIKANASKYMARQAASFLTQLNPMRLNSEVRSWTDTFPDRIPQLTEIGPSLGTLDRGATVRIAPGLERPYQWEMTASVEQQLAANLGLTVSYYHRRYYKSIVSENLALSPSDYIPVTIANPLDGSPFVVYNQNPLTVGRQDNVLVNSDLASTWYNAIEFNVDKRFSNDFMVFGGMTFGANKGCFADSTNPSDLSFKCGYTDLDSTRIGNFSVVYRMPHDFSLSSHFQYYTGQPLKRTFTVSRSQVPNLTQVNQAVWLAPEGTFRKPNQTLLDFRLSRTFKLAHGVQFEPILDLYNIVNENASVAEVEIVGPALGQISENVDGRLFRFGVRMSF